MELSFTEENYIKAIFTISQLNGGEGAGTNELSQHLMNKAASVSDMLKKLSEKKLIRYEKYKSATLTAKGEKIALSIVRRHRLWEVFLVDKLRFRWDEVHEIAEQLEHIRSEELADRLDEFLGFPGFDPHGDPIPDATGRMRSSQSRPLSAFSKPGRYIFTGVSEHSSAFLQHITSLGLKLGDKITVEEINHFDGSLKVMINGARSHFFSEKIASHLLVQSA